MLPTVVVVKILLSSANILIPVGLRKRVHTYVARFPEPSMDTKKVDNLAKWSACKEVP